MNEVGARSRAPKTTDGRSSVYARIAGWLTVHTVVYLLC